MKQVLVVSPHPDDESIGCGGTLLHHIKDGDKVHVVFLTSGEKGAKDISPDKLTQIRESEARRAAKANGFHGIEFWREPDGALKAHLGVVKRLRNRISELKPDIIYVTHEREMHPDHRSAAKIVRRALRQGSPLEKRPMIFGFEVWTPIQKIDHIVDISEVIKKKTAAIRIYKSQRRFMKFDQALLGLCRYRGEMFNWPGKGYAEVFIKIK